MRVLIVAHLGRFKMGRYPPVPEWRPSKAMCGKFLIPVGMYRCCSVHLSFCSDAHSDKPTSGRCRLLRF